jgi:hypothetical protein
MPRPFNDDEAMNADLKKWLAFGTGVGIEIAHEALIVTVVRLRPSGAQILGRLQIPSFRDQAAGEWGARYAEFLKKLGASHLVATVILPRDEVMVRLLSMPGVADKDLASAIRFEIEPLNPYSEEEAAWDWARIGKSPSILLGITRRSLLEKYQTLFAEAGVKVASLSFSAPVIYSALRLFGEPPVDGSLLFAEEADEIEVYGESAARPVYSARIAGPVERARMLAVAELRLPPDHAPALLADSLPKPAESPADLDLRAIDFSYAAALASAAPLRSISINLLPEGQRRSSSRIRFIPAAALAIIALMLAGAAVAYPRYSERQYLNLLQQEIRKIEPRARQAVELDRKIAVTRNRTATLDNFRRRTKDDLDALSDLTNLLAPPAWLNSMQLTRDSLAISGEAPQAAALLKALDGSHQFRGSSFTTPLIPSANGETFNIRAQRQSVTP